MNDNVIFLVDMQSFYASVEKVMNPRYKNMPLIVAGDPAIRSGIVLAACPLAKRHGITTAERLGEALNKCPDVIVARPHMERYIEFSLHISDILERFSDLVEPYSVDEQFLDVTASRRLFGEPEEMARKIQQTIRAETGIHARIGIGPNKVLAKIACDGYAKRNESGIFWLKKEEIPQKMWPLPLRTMFGIGPRMNAHLSLMGLRTIGDLARFPLERLQRRWGVNGHILWMTANGIDHSPVSPDTYDSQKAVGHFMTLPRDYRDLAEIRVVLLELSEEVCRRARSKGFLGRTVSVSCRGANFDVPTGFHRQVKLSDATSCAADVYEAACRLFVRHWDGLPVRAVGVALSQLCSDDTYQLDLFRDLEKERQLAGAVDFIKNKYGAAAIVRAASLTAAGQAYARAQKIGGHYK